MLVLTLRTDKKIIIEAGGEFITVMLCRTTRDRARLGFTSGPNVRIDREHIRNLKDKRSA